MITVFIIVTIAANVAAIIAILFARFALSEADLAIRRVSFSRASRLEEANKLRSSSLSRNHS